MEVPDPAIKMDQSQKHHFLLKVKSISVSKTSVDKMWPITIFPIIPVLWSLAYCKTPYTYLRKPMCIDRESNHIGDFYPSSILQITSHARIWIRLCKKLFIAFPSHSMILRFLLKVNITVIWSEKKLNVRSPTYFETYG